MKVKLLAVALLFVCAPALLAGAPTEGGTIPLRMPLFPPNNWWNTDITNAPVDAGSASFIATINSRCVSPCIPPRKLHPDWGGDLNDGTVQVYGFPFILVDGNQVKKTVTFDFSGESDGVNHTTNTSFPFYPVPDEAITSAGWIEEGDPGNVDVRGTSDRHMLIVDTTNNYLYELYNVYYNGTNWQAGSGAFFDMNTNNRRPEGWTSADAAGLAMLPGLVRYDEVYGSGEINHAFRMTVQNTNGYVFPASHSAGNRAGELPMGARLRLKASKDISSFPADVQKIYRAFKKYGLIVADNGSDMYVSGTYDNRWDMGTLNTAFSELTASDFDVVQLGWKPVGSFIVNVPATIADGATTSFPVTEYDANYVLNTAYRGTVHFTSTDGTATLPADYTFTAADNGAHTFNVVFRTTGPQEITATDLSDVTLKGLRMTTVVPATPTGVVASMATTTSINVSWTASAGATQYEVLRASGSGYVSYTTTASTSIVDSPVNTGATYAYKVRALDGGSRQSDLSLPDAATTIVFSDDPLSSGQTAIKSAHLDELRQAVNAMRRAGGLTDATFTDTALSGILVRTTHIQDLRNAVAPARTALGLPPLVVTDPSLTPGATLIKAAHVQELRDSLK